LIRARADLFLWTLAAAASMTGGSCAPGERGVPPSEQAIPDATEAEVASESVVRGMFVFGPEVRSITPCGEDQELWVVPVPELNAAYEALALEPYAPVFVEVEGRVGPAPETGFGADYDGQLVVSALRRAAPAREGFGCSEDVTGFAFRALGMEPFWNLRVEPSGIVYGTPESPVTRFAPPAAAREGDSRVYESTSVEQPPRTLRATFVPVPCRDPMVGAFYTWTATVEVDGELRRGCAWQGALAVDP